MVLAFDGSYSYDIMGMFLKQVQHHDDRGKKESRSATMINTHSVALD